MNKQWMSWQLYISPVNRNYPLPLFFHYLFNSSDGINSSPLGWNSETLPFVNALLKVCYILLIPQIQFWILSPEGRWSMRISWHTSTTAELTYLLDLPHANVCPTNAQFSNQCIALATEMLCQRQILVSSPCYIMLTTSYFSLISLSKKSTCFSFKSTTEWYF